MEISLKILIIFNIIISLVFFLFDKNLWLINFEIGYITSSIILYSSMLSYKKKIERDVKKIDSLILEYIGLSNKAKSSFFSLSRLSSYFLFIIAFLYISNNGLLYIPVYLISVGIPSLIIVFTLALNK